MDYQFYQLILLVEISFFFRQELKNVYYLSWTACR